MATQSQIYAEIRAWCREERISWRWITEYPDELFEDIQLLRRARCQYWHIWTAKQRGVWSGIWGVTTKKKRPLRQKNLIKLQQAVESAEATRERIKAHRHQVTQTGT